MPTTALATPGPRRWAWLDELPTQNLTWVICAGAFIATVLVYLVRIGRGLDLGEGALIFFGGVVTAWLGERGAAMVKRATAWKPTEIANAQVIAAQAPPSEVHSGPPGPAAVLPLIEERAARHAERRAAPAPIGPVTPLTPPGGRIEDDPNFGAAGRL